MKFAAGPVFDQNAAGPLPKESLQYGAATGVVVVVAVVVVVVAGVVEVVEVVVVTGVVEVVVVLVVADDVAAETTDVGADVAIVEPFLFVAITATRSVAPTSAATITYVTVVAVVAVVIGAHSAPELLQRFH